jgi:hypothetical protein
MVVRDNCPRRTPGERLVPGKLAQQARALRPRLGGRYREAIKYRFDGSPLIGPEKRKKKAIRTKNCLSDSEFFSFRFFLSIAGSGQSSGSPFFGYLLWRSKESDCPRGMSAMPALQ